MLISKEDLERIDRIEAVLSYGPEVLWLCKTARRLAAIKPTENEFPERLHLITAGHSVIPVRYAETVLIEKEFDFRGVSFLHFLHLLTCEKSDVFLFVRPYVKLLAPKDAGILERMEKEGLYTVFTDGDILWKGPLAQILVGLDGYGVHRKPMTLKMPERPHPNIFRCASDEDPMGAVQVAGVDLGVFLTNQTEVRIDLCLSGLEGLAKISIGLVAARYTSKGILSPVSKV